MLFDHSVSWIKRTTESDMSPQHSTGSTASISEVTLYRIETRLKLEDKTPQPPCHNYHATTPTIAHPQVYSSVYITKQ
jgi:hypothetical protein